MSTSEQRKDIAKFIYDHEARIVNHHLSVYMLPAGDGGGTYEVAGINNRYHPEEALALAQLISEEKYDEAAARAQEYIALQTDPVTTWTTVVALEAMLRDCSFNRGGHGAARILQRALGVEDDGYVGPATKKALASYAGTSVDLLTALRAAREQYERDVGHRDESSPFWKGLLNRWNDAFTFAKTFLTATTPASSPAEVAAAPAAASPQIDAPAIAAAAVSAPAILTGNFYESVIKKDRRYNAIDRVSDPDLLEPVTRAAVMAIVADANAHGYGVAIYETYRSQARQQYLFEHKATKLRTVGVHHYGMACDIVKRINGEWSWKGDFSFLSGFAKQHGLILGGTWGQPNVHHTFYDDDHVQRCTVKRQESLFTGQWYPSADYDPYKDGAT
ncbi:putative peptidoglycan-binding domain-containing protein [Methylobacterium sp. J-070]|uniref:putative peptidoglycan-binding domain-containing protein n=1 Tax=Methylobacterium sp. J-070 TaxID=2836650 RepID=UPI001FB87452|nr:putative peptidoglycan-binding domain-containing protein [Methylobacterium sp. J-070]MCJ2049667.1 hypothetical protein [Methylobacterium sp. J-070]